MSAALTPHGTPMMIERRGTDSGRCRPGKDLPVDVAASTLLVSADWGSRLKSETMVYYTP